MTSIFSLKKENDPINNANKKDSLIKVNHLLEILEKIFISPNYDVNFQLIYSKCHEICQNRMTNDLYSMIDVLINKIIQSYYEKLILVPDSEYLKEYISTFFYFQTKTQAITDALLYMERVRLRFKLGEETLIQNCMLTFFKRLLIETSNLKQKFISSMRAELNKVRRSNYIDNGLLHLVFKMIRELRFFAHGSNSCKKFYIEEIHPIIIKETQTFFSEEFPINSINNVKSCFEYLHNIDKVLKSEDLLFDEFEEKEEILMIIINNLIVYKAEYIFNYGVKSTILQESTESMSNLSLVYSLFFLRPNISQQTFYHHFNELIHNLLRDLENNFIRKNNFNRIEYFNFFQYVEELCALKHLFSNIQFNSFQCNTKIEQILKMSFEKLVNKYDDFMGNFIKLIHEEVKISTKTKSNVKVREFSEKFRTIFKLLSDKDLFEIEYRKNLSKRLLRNSQLIKETEIEFYDILKRESGVNFIKKIETMFNDIYISQDINYEFRMKKSLNQVKKKTPNSSNKSLPTTSINKYCDFYVKVLSNESWPIDREKSNPFISLPKELDIHVQEFTNFYNSKFKNRQLIWIHEYSWAEMNMRTYGSPLKVKLIVSSIQMSILMLFNKNSILTINDICSSLSMLNQDGKSLISQQLTPLIKSGILYEGNKSTLILNEKFSSKHNKIILNNSSKKPILPHSTEEKEVSHFVIEDRKHQIDAVIIKILKSSRKIHFDQLKLRIIEECRNYFVPEISLIKGRLDNLSDRNLITRDCEDTNIFVYTA
jgi:hypothetical protein